MKKKLLKAAIYTGGVIIGVSLMKIYLDQRDLTKAIDILTQDVAILVSHNNA